MMWYTVVILAVIFVALAFVVFSAICAPKYLDAVCKPSNSRTLDVSRKFQIEQEHWDFNDFDNVWEKHEFTLKAFDGVRIWGEYIVNGSNEGRKKVVVICHGHTCNHIHSVKYAVPFYQRGYNVVIYDNRFFGNSEGDICTLGQNETKDLLQVIDYAKEIFGKDCLLALHGESMGASTVLLASAQTEVDFVVADCPFADTFALYRDIARQKTHLPSFPAVDMASLLARRMYGYYFKSVSPIKVVDKIKCPVCFIHGTNDKFIYPKNSVKLHAKCTNPDGELHLFEGALHARSHMKDAQKYDEIVGNFIDKMERKLTKEESL